MKMIIIRGDQRAEYQESSGKFVGDAELIENIELIISVTARIGSDPYLQLSQNPHVIGSDSIEYIPDIPDNQMMDT